MSEKLVEEREQPKTFGRAPKNYGWYRSLKTSPLNPPQWVFPIAWTILYILIGISFFMYIKTTGWTYSKGLVYFIIQMVLNLIWSPIFFGAKKITWALYDIILMWIFILLTIVEFQKVSPEAAQCLYPYLAWVSFATYLNAYIVFNNP